MLTSQEITNIRTQAGVSPTPPVAPSSDANNIIAQRQAALGLNQPQTSTPAPKLSLGDRVAQSIQQHGETAQSIINDPTEGNPLTRGVKAAAQGAEAVLSPITEGIKSIIGQGNGGQPNPLSPGQQSNQQTDTASPLDKAVFEWSQQHPDAYNQLKNTLGGLSATGEIAGTVAGGETVPEDGNLGLSDSKQAITDAKNGIKNTISNTASKVKEGISPSLTPEEKVGKIIQGKTSDIPAAQRTFDALPSDTKPVAKLSPKELSDTIQKNVIQKNLEEVDTHFANDNKPHPMSDFEQTTGKGTSAVKTNYVQQSIDQLKDFYIKTNDAQGLSDIKALEEKANTEGLTSQELNTLAKEHGSTIKAFNANGEAASGLSKQAAENTRTGIKNTARNILSQSNPDAAAEVTRLDKETSDAIHTKDLLDRQVEKESIGIQKKGKPNAIEKFAKNNPRTARAIKYGTTAVIGGEAIKHVLP